MRVVQLSLAFALGVSGCGTAATASSPRDFEQASLNRAWYGAYHRPLPEGLRGAFERDGAAAAQREQEREDRRAARAAEREEQAAVAEPPRRAEPDDAAVSPTPGSRASLGPAASVPPPRQEAPPIPRASSGGFDAAAAAAYVRDVYAVNETGLGDDDGIAAMYRYATENGRVYHHTRPVVGDLVFFNNTHDADGDGRPNDFFSHVGVVENVDEEATVTVLSYLDGRVRRFAMNLEAPSVERQGGDEINTPIRERQRGDLASTAYLSGELFVGFAALLGSRSEVIVLDNWSPATRLDGLRAER